MFEEKIKKIIAEMTISEKIGQLRQCGPSLVGAFDVDFEELVNMVYDGRITKAKFDELLSTAQQDYHEDDIRSGKIGSFNGVGDAETSNRLQKIAVEESRLGIPLLIGYDILHGFRTVTPIPLAEGCAWEPDLWRETARMSAVEGSAAGIHMTFAPMVDISKDARWGRVSEGAGEDTLINTLYGVEKVKGFQGENLQEVSSLLACPKHFVAYGAAESGRDYNRVDLSPQRLFEEYMPPFEACVKAGARMIMPAFNDVNGIPCTSSQYLLETILRKEWGFDGAVISDANAIAELVEHGQAEDRCDAAKRALEAGLDIDMTSETYFEHLEQLIESGQVDIVLVDRAVGNVLRLKFELGLFDNPFRTNSEKESNSLLTEEHRQIAKIAAQESIVLLKNMDKTLPINKSEKIALVGRLAADRGQMTGAWAIKANGEDCLSLVDGLDQSVIDYTYFSEEEVTNSEINWALYDKIIYSFGENKNESGEAASRSYIGLPESQLELITYLARQECPLIGILFNGRPLALENVESEFDALIEAWHLGVEAGSALVDVLLGLKNPSGKLTTSFPRVIGQCPIYYNHFSTGRPAGKSKFTSKYLDVADGPLYPFGFGLSYTNFEYTDLILEEIGDQIHLFITLTNTGEHSGKEITQCYVRDVVAQSVRPVNKLVTFAKTSLKPMESKRLKLIVDKKQLGYFNQNMEYVLESGRFVFQVGTNSKDGLTIDWVLENKEN